jgi:transcriptional regulator with XRE-family HTH domain
MLKGMRLRRAMRGWSQRELARKSEIAQCRISLIERGLQSPSSDERTKLIQLLGRKLRFTKGDLNACPRE